MKRIALRARRFLMRIVRAGKAELRASARRHPIQPHTVLYESFGGNGALCNPEAVFRELLARTDPAISMHVWAFDQPRRHASFRKEFAGNRNVRVVRRGSVRYHRALATSGYLINNATFPIEFVKRIGQVYLNTWHGTPLKLMGYDMPDGVAQSANTRRNFLTADYLLSQSSFMTETMYADAYRLRGAFRGRVIEAGYPRVDHQFGESSRSRARNALADAGIELAARTIVLYAPTWKGSSFANPENDIDEIIRDANEMQAALGTDHLVLVKAHQAVWEFAENSPEFRRIMVPNDIPTNELLGLVDLLVTDYSSIFFDYLASDRPIVFYTPDTDPHAFDRGTYFPTEELPGPICRTAVEVASTLVAPSLERDWQERRDQWASRFAPQSDGGAAARVVDIVFRGKRSGPQLVSLEEDSRVSVLIHLGGMRSNGITTSALNLLEHLDYGKFQVSVVFTRPSSSQQWQNQARIDPRAIQFHRSGGMGGHKWLHLLRRLANRRADGEFHRRSLPQSELWLEEWSRCFGDSTFDSVIDFSGYSPLWATLLLHSPPARRSIWMHNDMESETRRVIRGRMRMLHSLRAVFALYSQYDAVVSVSQALRDINRRNLAQRYHLSDDAFLAAPNVVNEHGVLSGARQPLLDPDGYPLHPEDQQSIIPEWARLLDSREGTVWFFSVGRFSTEKNQARLLRAFATVHSERPDTRLLLIGYGPLRGQLDALVVKLGLQDAAFVDGPFQNPFRFVAASQCFVLSSTYEGQPMVLLEAAIVGIPIVTVEFPSVASAIPSNSMRIVAQSDDALAEGMREFLRGTVPPTVLDSEAYNALAVAGFAQAAIPTRE